MLYFSANWCAPCKTWKPSVESAAELLNAPFIEFDYSDEASYSKYVAGRTNTVPVLIVLNNDKEVLYMDEAGGVAQDIVNAIQYGETDWAEEMLDEWADFWEDTPVDTENDNPFYNPDKPPIIINTSGDNEDIDAESNGLSKGYEVSALAYFWSQNKFYIVAAIITIIVASIMWKLWAGK